MGDSAVTEQFGSYRAELYRLETEDAAPLAVTRVRPKRILKPHPVVLMHGSYSNRHFWLSPKGIGLAGFLVDQGFDVWLPEWRGHGRSQKSADYRRWTAENIIRYDYAAASGFITRKTRRQPIWVGHSFGGLLLLAALARGWLPQDKVAAAAVFGAQVTYGEDYLRLPPLAWAARSIIGVLGKFPARIMQLGPEDEPPAVVQEIIGWKQRGLWSDSTGTDYKELLRTVRIPCKVFAGAGDTTDPAIGCEELFHLLGSARKEYSLLGLAQGFQCDYGHVDMIVSKAAAEEVWPRLQDWLERVGSLRETLAG